MAEKAACGAAHADNVAPSLLGGFVLIRDYFPLDVEPWNPNLTTLVAFDTKWKGMLGKKIPIPTPAGEEFREEIGVYEGGGYVAKGVFRPMIDCRMHTNDAVFCPVCSQALKRMMAAVTDE